MTDPTPRTLTPDRTSSLILHAVCVVMFSPTLQGSRVYCVLPLPSIFIIFILFINLKLKVLVFPVNK